MSLLHALPPRYGMLIWKSSIPIILQPNVPYILHHFYLKQNFLCPPILSPISGQLCNCVNTTWQQALVDQKHLLAATCPYLNTTGNNIMDINLISSIPLSRNAYLDIFWPNAMVLVNLWISFWGHVQPLLKVTPCETTLSRAGGHMLGEGDHPRAWPQGLHCTILLQYRISSTNIITN